MYRFYKQALSAIACSLLLVVAAPPQQAQAQADQPQGQVEQPQVPMQPQAQGSDDAYVSYQDFYDNLAPYGQWVDDPQYGYVWTPNVSSDFRPYYTNGHWMQTQYGNTWASDYAWGWAPFHYGRWTYDDYYGWVWIPGSEWGPAWVSWRAGDGNYGWAPLGPGYSFNSVYGDYSCPADWWVFIPQQYIYTGNYYHYYYGPRNNQTIINNTTVINNTYENNHITYVAGPRTNEVEAATHQQVKVYHLANSSTNLNTRVHSDVVKMYRPMEVKAATADNGPRPTPPNVIRAPQPIRTPVEVSSHTATSPTFKADAPHNNTPVTAPGNIHYNNEPAHNEPARNNEQQPYQWDVNKSQPQRVQPVQQEQPRQQPQPQPQRAQQPVRQQAPQPMRSAPAQQQMRSAPAPQRSAPMQSAPRPSGGGGRR